MSTHNLCFRAKIRKNVYPCKPQFYYIKVGCKGVFVTRTCFRDVYLDSHRTQVLIIECLARSNCGSLSRVNIIVTTHQQHHISFVNKWITVH